MKTAVCTLLVGERFEKLFDQYCARSWQNYCSAHRYELFIFRKAFSPLPGKSMAWQKLFLLEQPELKAFDRIIWVDADIIIKQNAPALDVPGSKIGFVLEQPFTGSVESWYALFALPPAQEIVQTGVLSLQHEHREILARARDYPETQMYEMPALSKCISDSGVGYHLDPRFNALLGTIMLDYAPRWLVTNKPMKELAWRLHYPPLHRAVRDVCERNWFIHAAGAKRDLVKTSQCLAQLQMGLSPSNDLR